MNVSCRNWCASALLLALPLATGLQAQEAPEKRFDIEAKIFKHEALTFEESYDSVASLKAKSQVHATDMMVKLQALNVSPATARLDARTGRFATLLPTTPLLPGRGVGNDLTWSELGMAVPKSADARKNAAWNAFRNYLAANADTLGLDMSELGEHRIASHNDGDIIQINVPRVVNGVEVRGASVSGVIGQGNLTLFNMSRWGNVGNRSVVAPIGPDAARDKAADYAGVGAEREWGKPELVFLPMAQGQGMNYVLAWSVKLNMVEDFGNYEVLINARNGQVLSFEDTNHYAEAKGGVLPVTNDGVVPDGVEQAGWPMPFLNVTVGGSTVTTDTGGNFTGSGSATSSLVGPYVRMNDNCGSISLTQSGGLDFGTSTGTDCTTPGIGGAGNTHSSRTGFYELNKIIEMGRGQLPSNSWLQAQLTSNMNINSTCNAFWNGTVNFYRSGGGCFNTGEIAGVFDHEWGHGMDANDVNGGIASPSGEGIADVYTALRLNDSCIGRNFRSSVCTGNGDPCLTCTGVRDIDYLKRQSGNPHTYTWSNANCSGSVHCVGGVYSEAVWSLWKRKLQSAPYNYDNNTAHEIVTRLTYIGAGATSTWFSGGPPNGGCAASSGYMNYLAADDDNGNLNDGTPHMSAIYAAFNDQQIACQTPTVQDAGCAGAPSTAPSVSVSAGNQSASLSWSAVSGASAYEVFRTEGVFGCDFGKVKVADTAGTSFNDSGLQNGREYSYIVIAKGSSDACFGPASSCTQVTPASAPDFTVSCAPSSTSISQGASGNLACTVGSLGGYSGSVSLSCAGAPAGVSCGFAPASVSLPANGTANSTLTLSVALSQATGSYNFNVQATDGSITKTSGVDLAVTPEGQNGPQDAVFNAGLGAPACSTPGTECDTNALVNGRGTVGPESNQPNTLDGCTDGTSGTYQSDESVERVVVRTLDGYDFAEGATVEVAVTVWAYSNGSSDTLDLYYAADANSPSWTLIGSQAPSAGSSQTLTAQYTLPAGALQAVRASFRYQGSAAPCSTGGYDDADDLVFAVNSASNSAPSVSITAPANGSSSTQGGSVAFAGSASDNEDGNLTASLSWSSSLDGAIGSGGSFSTSSLSVGNHTITASVSDSGGLSGSASVSITVNAPTNNAPSASITAPANGSSYDEGTSVSFTGTASDTEDGDLTASLSWSSSLDGAIGSGGSFSTAALSVGSHTITASVSDSGGLSASDSISVTINSVGGGGPQDAVYDAALGAPACATVGSECDSTTLLNSRGSLATAEPNQPNTLDTCTDGSSGTYHSDESNDRIVVRTLDGTDFAAGKTVEVAATVWGWNTGSSDHLDLYYAADANSPAWTLIGTIDLTAGGAQTLTAQYTLPAGSLQAVRANFRYNGSQSSCSTGNYDDTDDLVFAVAGAGGGGGGGGGVCAADEDFSGGAPGWTTSGTCTTGTFVVGNPDQVVNGGVTTQVGGDHTGTGSALFSAPNTTSAGQDDIDGGTCTVTSPAYAVSVASNVSVWYFHGQRDAGGDAADGFLLEVSKDGGSNWTTLQSYGDVTVNAVWTQATTTAAAGDNVVFRLSATDGTTSGDLVEAGLDDVSICPQ